MLRYAGKTHVGRKRSSNQDHFLAAEVGRYLRVEATSLNQPAASQLNGPPMATMLMVADGMGGHQAGQRASELAIQHIVGRLLAEQISPVPGLDASSASIESRMQALLISAHRAILADSKASDAHRGMGTTLTMVCIQGLRLWLVHAGDSRCYLYRDASLTQLTRDHTLADQMFAQGLVEGKLAESSPWSNILWNALGAGSREITAESHEYRLQPGDRILLCSDGLNKHVPDDQIGEFLAQFQPPAEACEQLIQAACDGGGSDNITVIVADYSEISPIDEPKSPSGQADTLDW